MSKLDKVKSDNNNPLKIEIHPISQYTKLSHFESFMNYYQLSLLNVNEPLSNNIDLDVSYNLQPEADKIYEVLVRVSSISEYKGQKIYSMEVRYGGLFKLQSDALSIPFQMQDQVLKIHCANLIYPFVRQEIVKLSVEGGFPPLMLGMVDFKSLYDAGKINGDYQIN